MIRVDAVCSRKRPVPTEAGRILRIIWQSSQLPCHPDPSADPTHFLDKFSTLTVNRVDPMTTLGPHCSGALLNWTDALVGGIRDENACAGFSSERLQSRGPKESGSETRQWGQLARVPL